jgi:hypothetical protein
METAPDREEAALPLVEIIRDAATAAAALKSPRPAILARQLVVTDVSWPSPDLYSGGRGMAVRCAQRPGRDSKRLIKKHLDATRTRSYSVRPMTESASHLTGFAELTRIAVKWRPPPIAKTPPCRSSRSSATPRPRLLP